MDRWRDEQCHFGHRKFETRRRGSVQMHPEQRTRRSDPRIQSLRQRWVKMSSMIHSARSTVPPATVTIFTWKLLCFGRFWKVGTDRLKYVWTTCVKTGRDCGSAEWIKTPIFICNLCFSGRRHGLPSYVAQEEKAKEESGCGEFHLLFNLFPTTQVINWVFQEKFEWVEEPIDKKVKQGHCPEVSFTCKLSHKGKKAKWYAMNQVSIPYMCRVRSARGGGVKKNLFLFYYIRTKFSRGGQ